MAAISLNLQQKVHPVIWSVANLPFDCTRAIPIKKPLGGTLIFSMNGLIYLNQSIPPYGVSLNSVAETSTNFPLSNYSIMLLLMSYRNIICRGTRRFEHHFRLLPSGIP